MTPLSQRHGQDFVARPGEYAARGHIFDIYPVTYRNPVRLEFEGETRAVLKSVHKNHAGDPRAEFRIDGTEGSIRGTIGLMYDYPRGRADTLELNSRVLPTDGWLHYPVTSRWIPTAFIGPMASLLEEVATGGAPLTNGRDNLDTLRIVQALYRSGAEHVVVKLR